MEERLDRQSFLVSLLLHFLLMAALLMWSMADKQPAKRDLVWVDLQSPKTKNQIVESEKGKKTDKAAEDAFLGKETRVVDRQTVSKPTEGYVSSKRSRPSRAQQANKKTAQAPSPALDLKNLGVPIFNVKNSQEAQKDQPQWVQSDALREDYVKGMKEGEVTALNTKEYVFFSYFQRIREQLDRAWRPILRQQLLALMKRGRRPASDSDFTTRTLVTLNKSGEVIRVQVIEESGTRDLDDAAVQAFNRAGPFPNPPQGLIERNSTIQIQWEFILRT